MVNWEKKFEKSPYDSSGMPLAAVTVDCDVKEDVAKTTVHDKYEAPLPLFSDDDPDFQPELKRTKFNPALNNTAIQAPGHVIHKAHAEDIGTGIPELTDPPVQADLEDNDTKREIIVEDSERKGIAVPELPKVAKDEEVKEVKDKAEEKDDDLFQSAEGVKKEEDVNTLSRHNDPADDDFMKALKNAE